MNDEKKIGFSVELENNRVDLWAHGDDETLVNLAVAALANIVAAACGNDMKEAEKLLQDVKIGLDAALDQALEHPTQEINPEDLKAIGPADLPQSLSGKFLRKMKPDFGGKKHGRSRNVFPEREVPPDVR